MRRAKRNQVERYDLEHSPLAMRPTQKQVAALLQESKTDLRLLARYKEQFIVRREIVDDKRKKTRQLAYPVDRLRAVHERLKYHLNKVKQPSYLFSPRKGRSQRDNATLHLDQTQFLTLDLRQFYPSTSSAMVRRWLTEELGMYDDVSRLLTMLATVDDRVSFGSPLTPVLCTMVHRAMFDEIALLCDNRNLQFSLWVDDLTISGDMVPGSVVRDVREVIRSHGLKSHKILYRTGSRPVFITGIGVVGRKLVGPSSLNLRIKELWSDLHAAQTDAEKEDCIRRLLSNLGTLRYIAGRTSEAGRRAADQMNSLRQKKEKLLRGGAAWRDVASTSLSLIDATNAALPF